MIISKRDKIDNETLAFVLCFVNRHLKCHLPSEFLLDIAEHAIENSEGKTPERYELLKIWKYLYEVLGE